eukprot:2100881-Rhodomonas_salina.4
MSGTDRAYGATVLPTPYLVPTVRMGEHTAYGPAARCPVLTERVVLRYLPTRLLQWCEIAGTRRQLLLVPARTYLLRSC